jgi:hypothetical protein
VKQELDRNKNGAARLQIVDSAKESTKESAKKSIKGFAKQKSRAVIESADPERHSQVGAQSSQLVGAPCLPLQFARNPAPCVT